MCQDIVLMTDAQLFNQPPVCYTAQIRHMRVCVFTYLKTETHKSRQIN